MWPKQRSSNKASLIVAYASMSWARKGPAFHLLVSLKKGLNPEMSSHAFSYLHMLNQDGAFTLLVDLSVFQTQSIPHGPESSCDTAAADKMRSQGG